MDSLKVVESTDKFSNFIVTENKTYRNKIKIKKEAFIYIYSYKKVGQPARGKINKKCAKIKKKTGCTPLAYKLFYHFY